MSESNRIYASISFVTILIVVGMPLWWKTTEVYRVTLPYTRISNLNNMQIKIAMNIQIASFNINNALNVKNSLEEIFYKSEIFNITFTTKYLPKSSITKESILNININPGNLILIEWPKLETDIYVTSSRTIFYSSKISVIKLAEVVDDWILAEKSLTLTAATMSTFNMTTNVQNDAAGKRRVPPSKMFDINLSIVIPNPDKIKIVWSPKDALEKYIEPFVSKLSAIHNFTLKSQWLYFVQLDFNPKQIQDDTVMKRHYSLPEDVLPHLITPLEKKLASHISKNPCLNFVLYIPPCEQSPIHIYNKKGIKYDNLLNAFLSPRWGGIIIGNPSSKICVPYLFEDIPDIPTYHPPTKEIMGFFLSQLRLLLGIQSQRVIKGVEIEGLKNASPRQWELDSLMRIRTIEQVYSAKLTLHSLSQLLGEISNIVINDDVGASVYNAVENIERTIDHLRNERLTEALNTSREAFISAEAAFTDPSLLALLYFPDDQKYAVYIPLFLPVMIPVIMSFKNIWNWIKSGNIQKEKTD